MGRLGILEKRVEKCIAQNRKILTRMTSLYHNQRNYLERRSKQRGYFKAKVKLMKELSEMRKTLLKEIGIYRAYSGARRKDGKCLYWFTVEERHKIKRILKERWKS